MKFSLRAFDTFKVLCAFCDLILSIKVCMRNKQKRSQSSDVNFFPMGNRPTSEQVLSHPLTN
jgi:hypothetical protein